MTTKHAKATLAQGRTVIAKFRKVAEARPGFTLVHERQRKTKDRPEVNVYSLLDPRNLILATINTTSGEATWRADIREALHA